MFQDQTTVMVFWSHACLYGIVTLTLLVPPATLARPSARGEILKGVDLPQIILVRLQERGISDTQAQ
jgi:hypothetical protein